MFSPLQPWLERKHPLPSRFLSQQVADIIEQGGHGWVGMETLHPLHEAHTLEWHSLRETRKATDQYLNRAKTLVGGLESGWLDREEAEVLFAELGPPPPCCVPIYLISLRHETKPERLAYVGRTRTENRFSGGHSVALKLHDPQYADFTKHIYLCSVCLYHNDEYIALEWLEPESLAESVLDSVESQLIYHFKPIFNTQKSRTYRARRPITLAVENFVGDFLNDVVFPPGMADRLTALSIRQNLTH